MKLQLQFRKPRNRTAFTLIEVLVTIGIIALLTTLLIVAVGPSLENARISATKVTLAQINDVIQQRLDAIARMDVSSEAKKLAALNSITEAQATFFIRTNLYRQALPQRPEDLKGIDTSSMATSDDATFGGSWNGATSSSWPDGVTDTSSSALLYLALTKGGTLKVLPSGRSYTVPLLDPGAINPKHVAQLDVDSSSSTTLMTGFVDSWEQPLRFYNFPTCLIRRGGGTNSIDVANARVLISGLPDNSSNVLLGTDPFDPLQTACTPFLSGITLYYAPSQSLTAAAFNETNYHTLNTYFVPLLVSAGPDQEIGLGEPSSGTVVNRLSQVLDSASIMDNLSNRQ